MKYAEKACAYATKCTSAFHANQRYMCTVRANYDAHGSRLMSWVYICELHYVIDLSCTCRLCCKHFQKLIKFCSICMCVWSSLNWAVPYIHLKNLQYSKAFCWLSWTEKQRSQFYFIYKTIHLNIILSCSYGFLNVH